MNMKEQEQQRLRSLQLQPEAPGPEQVPLLSHARDLILLICGLEDAGRPGVWRRQQHTGVLRVHVHLQPCWGGQQRAGGQPSLRRPMRRQH